VHARTDEAGIARCAFASEPHEWAIVQAPGRVAQVTALAEGTTRVTLPPARMIHVGCAGPAGDRCGAMAAPPVCAGSEGRSSGICRFVEDDLVCWCAPDADRLVHDTFGTVLLGSGDSAWYDLRGIDGSVSGQIAGRQRCTVQLQPVGAAGLVASTDDEGTFHVPFVPDGGYMVEAQCLGPAVRVGAAIVSRTKPQVTLPTLDLARGRTVGETYLRSELPEPEPEDDPERELLDYAFPSLPADFTGSPNSSCTMRVTIGADGRAEQAEPRRGLCSEKLAPLAAEALEGWRWASGPEATTETLVVPFK
jgi:hypothetical protein